jgi:hypothetical protein
MTLHLILRRAAAAGGCPTNQIETWPAESDDPGWGDLFACLFQDQDVLMLYDAPKYGMKDMGGVNMEPSRWFSEFGLPYPVPERIRDTPRIRSTG